MSQPLITEQFDPQSFSLFTQTFAACDHQAPIICASDVFKPFRHLPWSMLLHSGNSQHENSRYDIIVANPMATIMTTNKLSTVIDNQGNSQQTEQDPLVWIKQAIESYLTKPQISANTKTDDNCKLPFMGGALGYFGYDLGKRYETLPNTTVDDTHIPDLAVGIYEWAIIKDNRHNIWWFVSHRLNLQDVIEQLSNQQNNGLKTKKRTEQRQAIQTPTPQSFMIKDNWVSNINRNQYSQKFTQVQDYLKSGDCYQINLAQRFTAKFTGDDYQAFNALLKANQSPFSAYLNFADFTVLSLSPERLLNLNAGHIESKPIKGTIARTPNPNENQINIDKLQQSVKDRAENVMIVDLLRNDIGRVSKAGSVKVPRLFAIESFPAVHHLVSTVTGELKPKLHATDLLRAAFPGGSITGAPKVRAMEIIDQLEPHRRSIYCGSIGYICCTGNMDTSITIRTLLCKDSKVHAWAGGGIVADSTCESEYQETYAKVSKILPVLSSLHQAAQSDCHD